MCRFAYRLVLLAAILPTFYLIGCDVDVSAPADPARVNVDASRRLDPAFQPNPAAFAPKFIAFFFETATAAR